MSAGTTPALRDAWEETSFRLERLQASEATVAAEQAGLAKRTAPQWRLPFTPEWTPPEKLDAQDKVRPHELNVNDRTLAMQTSTQRSESHSKSFI